MGAVLVNGDLANYLRYGSIIKNILMFFSATTRPNNNDCYNKSAIFKVGGDNRRLSNLRASAPYEA